MRNDETRPQERSRAGRWSWTLKRVQERSKAVKWNWTLKRAQEISRGGRRSWALIAGWTVLLLKCSSTAAFLDTVLVTLFRTAVETAEASKNTKAWAVKQQTDTSKNTKAWAVKQQTDTSKNTKGWAVSQQIDTSKNIKAWAVSQHNIQARTPRPGLCHNTLTPAKTLKGLGFVTTH